MFFKILKGFSLLSALSISIYFGTILKDFSNLIPEKIAKKQQSKHVFDTLGVNDMNNIKEVSIKGKKFFVELAVTPEELSRGLMYRDFLEENEGMLFIFSVPDYHGFWMKNTLIPLDIIYIDDNFRIVDIVTLKPCGEGRCSAYKPKNKAQFVLEINAGLSKKYNFNIGDEVLF